MVQKHGLDWGSNYDPLDKFCGPYDCYKILNFDREVDQDGDTITKKRLSVGYRQASKKWHPDRNKSDDAKKMFQKISRANDVLGNKERLDSYNFYSTADTNLYHRAFDTKVDVIYAPEAGTVTVIGILLGFLSLITFMMQKIRWSNAAEKTAKAASRKMTSKNGGTVMTEQISERAAALIKLHAKQLKRGGKGEVTDMQKVSEP